MIQFFFKTNNEDEFSIIPELREGCWIHVDEASKSDLEELGRLSGIEYADLADCLDKYEIPRIEKIHDHVLIFTRYPTEHEIGLYTSTLTIILTRQYVITICPYKSSLIKHFVESRTRITTQQKTKLLIELFLKITQEFTAQIRRVRYSVLKQEKEMIHVESDDITGLTKYEEILNQYLSTLTPLRNVLEAIISGRYIFIHEQEKEHERLDDLRIAVTQSEDLCSIVIKSIRSLRDSYQIIFTNNLHKTIKLLTALTIIFNIPTMIASIYGMNIVLPMEGSAYAFGVILMLIIVLSGAGLFFFRRKKWL